jgi:hypothetical protein
VLLRPDRDRVRSAGPGRDEAPRATRRQYGGSARARRQAVSGRRFARCARVAASWRRRTTSCQSPPAARRSSSSAGKRAGATGATTARAHRSGGSNGQGCGATEKICAPPAALRRPPGARRTGARRLRRTNSTMSAAAASRRQASECWRHSSAFDYSLSPASAATSADTASAIVLNVLPVMADDGTAKLLTN